MRSRVINGYGLIPYDRAVKIPDSILEVNIEHMMSDNPERKRAVMYLQLIRIVSGSSNGMTNASTYQSFYKKNKKEGSLSSQYYRLFLFRDVTSTDGQVVYIVEGKNMNDKLWARYPLLRDNGVVTIGTYITILNPLPITMKFCNEIPIIECRGGCFVMEKCASVMEINIDMAITNNTTRSFVRNNVTIDVLSTDVHTTKLPNAVECFVIGRGQLKSSGVTELVDATQCIHALGILFLCIMYL